MPTLFRPAAALLATALLAVVAGCESSIAPDPVDTSSTTEFFVFSLAPGASVIYDFNTTRGEYTRVTYMRASSAGPFDALDQPLRIRLGLSRGGVCEEIVAVDATPAFDAQIARIIDEGSYCVEVIDTGALTRLVGGIIRIVHPPPVTAADPRTISSRSIITVDGSVTVTFRAQGPGQLSATLLDLSSDGPAGFGVGLVNPQGSNCLLSQTVETLPADSPQFSLPVEPGNYCVAVFDVGNFAEETSYLLSVEHP